MFLFGSINGKANIRQTNPDLFKSSEFSDAERKKFYVCLINCNIIGQVYVFSLMYIVNRRQKEGERERVKER